MTQLQDEKPSIGGKWSKLSARKHGGKRSIGWLLLYSTSLFFSCYYFFPFIFVCFSFKSFHLFSFSFISFILFSFFIFSLPLFYSFFFIIFLFNPLVYLNLLFLDRINIWYYFTRIVLNTLQCTYVRLL